MRVDKRMCNGGLYSDQKKRHPKVPLS
jgi:hypothetical protein